MQLLNSVAGIWIEICLTPEHTQCFSKFGPQLSIIQGAVLDFTPGFVWEPTF